MPKWQQNNVTEAFVSGCGIPRSCRLVVKVPTSSAVGPRTISWRLKFPWTAKLERDLQQNRRLSHLPLLLRRRQDRGRQPHDTFMTSSGEHRRTTNEDAVSATVGNAFQAPEPTAPITISVRCMLYKTDKNTIWIRTLPEKAGYVRAPFFNLTASERPPVF